MKIKLILAVRALNIGGAERQFLELVKHINLDRFEVCVMTLRKGMLDREIPVDGRVHLLSLEKRSRYNLGFLSRYASVINSFQPDVVYSFMLDMNVFSTISLRLARHRPKLCWGIFGSEPDFAQGPKFLRILFWLQKRLEPSAHLITSDSQQGFVFLRKYGYKLAHTEVIFSGTDIQRFQCHPHFRAEFRQQYNLKTNDIAVGICSRLSHMKGYPILAEAASRLLAEFPQVQFFAVGYGDEAIREQCVAILGKWASRFAWLGKQHQPERYYSGWDIYCSSSIYGEGFSNSIIEAMASELPCVATEVGDAKIQVGETGFIVKPGNVDELYSALKAMITNSNRNILGAAARQRILNHFSVRRMVQNTENAMVKLVNGDSGSLDTAFLAS